jgi:hypothetical protein
MFKIPSPPNQMWMRPVLEILIARTFEVCTASPNFDCPVKAKKKHLTYTGIGDRRKTALTHMEN